jgi:hypothetical protein
MFHITGNALFHQILPKWQENTGYGQSGHLGITFLGHGTYVVLLGPYGSG